ncbi:MAG: carbon-nitrogen hydrolase family protein [Armatimonadota bacterium]|nr:carbon-nitrogen hydrolase family protein [Armatimonadota bacterium]
MSDKKAASQSIRVSVVQFRSSRDLEANVVRHKEYIERCAAQGSRVIVFPECSVTGYFADAIEKLDKSRLEQAEAELCKAAAASGVYVVAGIPTFLPDKAFNSAVVITPAGRIIERYHKIQLAGEKWAVPGDHLSVFSIDGVLCSIIICHDERYPEFVRLPVLAGARIIFYISHESGLQAPEKIEPYRAQIVARAVENTVYVVHANAPWDKSKNEGSHGQSRIISPSGQILVEAGIEEEQVIAADLDIKKADRWLALRSLDTEFLKSWWEQGIRLVRRINE